MRFGFFRKTSNLSESAISKGKDLPDHVNESESHFSAMSSQSSEIPVWVIGIRLARAGAIAQPPLPDFPKQSESLRAQEQSLVHPNLIVRDAVRWWKRSP